VWPKFVWIVHSVNVTAETCGGLSLDGVVTMQTNHSLLPSYIIMSSMTQAGQPQNNLDVDVHPLSSCYLSTGNSDAHSIVAFQQVEEIPILLFTMQGSVEALNSSRYHFPSDLPPQSSSRLFVIVLFYLGNTICLVIVTISLILYIYFRNEPAVKATSVSLSVLIYIGNYSLILHMFNLNSGLLPTLYQQDIKLRNTMCNLLAFFNGLAFPLAIIFSTLLVKLLRSIRYSVK